MFSCDSAAPATGKLEAKRLRLTDAFEWIGADGSKKLVDLSQLLGIALDQ
jgi:hypothetical protein